MAIKIKFHHKKTKISHQPTRVDMSGPSTATPQPSPTPFSAARARKVNLFSEQEVNESTGIQKSYWQFWNDKAEELCRSNALKTFKPGEIQGVINVAWSLKKTDILKDQIEEVNKEIASKCSTDELKKFQMSKKTVEKNGTCWRSCFRFVKNPRKFNNSQAGICWQYK